MSDEVICEWVYDGDKPFSLACEYCGPWVTAEIVVEDGQIYVREFHAADCRYAAWFHSDDDGEPPPWEVDSVIREATEITWRRQR